MKITAFLTAILLCLLPFSATPHPDPTSLSARRAEALSRLRTLNEAIAETTGNLALLRQRKTRIEARLHAKAAALGPLLPLLERLSLFPADMLLAAPAPPKESLRGLLVLRGLTHGLQDRALALRTDQAALQRTLTTIDEQTDRLLVARDAQQQQAMYLDQQIAAVDVARQREQRKAVAEWEASRPALPVKKEPAPTRVDGDESFTVPVAGPMVRHWGETTEAGPANGLTFQAAAGARVLASCSGLVVFAGPFRSYGKLMIVDCGRGYHLVLAGMDHLTVVAGHRIRLGESVGTMAGDQPDLYVELRRGDQPVDPAPYLSGAAKG